MFQTLVDMTATYKADVYAKSDRHYDGIRVRWYILFNLTHDDVRIEFSKYGGYGQSLDDLAGEAVQKVDHVLSTNVHKQFAAPLLEAPSRLQEEAEHERDKRDAFDDDMSL